MIKSILTTYDNVKAWFDKANLSVLACDTELVDMRWLTMQLAGISFCDGKQACYIDFAYMEKYDNEHVLTECLDTVIYLREFMQDFEGVLVMHNSPFDLMVLKKYKVILEEIKFELFDTMVAAHLILETQPKGLKALACKYLGVPVSEAVDWNEAISDGFHSEKFYKYALSDPIWTYQLYEIFKEELKKQKLEDLFYNIEMPFQFCLRDLAINGIAADKEKLLELQGQLKDEVRRLQLAMYDAGGIEYYFQDIMFEDEPELIPALNINSTQQLSKFIRKDLGIKLTEKTKPSKLYPTGQYSTKNTVLESIKSQHKFIELLLDYRGAFKLLNSFLIPLPNLIQKDNRIRVNFMNTVAVTGRLTCSRLHQLPKEQTGPVPVRQCFIAPKGKVLLVADYAGQELRVLAHVSKDPTMIQAFKDKIDVHFLIANIFFKLGIPTGALVETHPDYKGYRKKFKSERDKIKTINFGIAYGKSAYGFAKDWNIPEPEAKKFIGSYFKRFPNIRKALDKCSYKTKQQKGIRNLTGRIRRFEYVDKGALRQAFNFLIQGPSADMMKKAAGDVRQLLLQHPEWNCMLVLSVHDELIWELNENYVEEAMPIIKKTTEDAIELCIPVVVDIGYGTDYASAKP